MVVECQRKVTKELCRRGTDYYQRLSALVEYIYIYIYMKTLQVLFFRRASDTINMHQSLTHRLHQTWH
jgi:hypothetical protein